MNQLIIILLIFLLSSLNHINIAYDFNYINISKLNNNETIIVLENNMKEFGKQKINNFIIILDKENKKIKAYFCADPPFNEEQKKKYKEKFIDDEYFVEFKTIEDFKDNEKGKINNDL